MAKWKRESLSHYARSRVAGQNSTMKYFVYILKSLKNRDIYIGSAADIDKRIKLHNKGAVKSTKGYRPWKLLEYEEFKTRSEAVQREQFLKNHQQKEILKKKYESA